MATKLDFLQMLPKLLVTVVGLIHCCCAGKYQAINTETCETEVFRARCPYPQTLLITGATYGHIQVSRCVAVDFGYFGCVSDVQDIISNRCNGKSRCEISTPDADISATKTCLAGLEMYLDITYVCIPKLLQHPTCSGIQVTSNRQYITSTQLSQGGCGVNGMPFTAEVNMKVKFTFTKITSETDSSRNTTNEEVGYIDSEDNSHISIMLDGDRQGTDIISSGHVASVVINGNLGGILLIEFQETGCKDLVAPPYTIFVRDGDKATLTCQYSDHKWQLSCTETKWVGGLGNCTGQIKKETVLEVPLNEKREVQTTKAKRQVLSKEILFALIIGMTFFLCAVVITTGYVCLKRAKYASRALQKDNIELNSAMLEGDGTSSWTKKTVRRNGGHMNSDVQAIEWQQTLPTTQNNQPNGTLSINGQKYFILDRDG